MKKRILPFLILFLFLLCKEPISYLLSGNTPEKEEIELLQLQSELEYYKSEAENLKNALQIGKDASFEIQYAKIINRDIYHFWDECTINKGEKNGIQKNMPVIGEKGLIGIISEVSSYRATIQLLSQKENQISIVVNGTYGLLRSDGSTLKLKHLTHYSDVHVDDLIYSSGLGSIPKGIPIAKITSIEDDALGIEPKIQASSLEKIDEISIVGVLEGNAS